jgi:hypothetical protein
MLSLFPLLGLNAKRVNGQGCNRMAKEEIKVDNMLRLLEFCSVTIDYMGKGKVCR